MDLLPTLWMLVTLAAAQQGTAITVLPYPNRPHVTSPRHADSQPAPQQHLYRPAVIPAAVYLVPNLPHLAPRFTQLPQQTVTNPRITHNLAGVPTVASRLGPKIVNHQTFTQTANENPIVFVSYPQAGGAGVTGRSGNHAAALRFPEPPPGRRYSLAPHRNPKVAGESRLPAVATISHQQHALGSIDRQYESSEPQSVRESHPAGLPFKGDYRALATNQHPAQSHASSGGSESGGAHKASSAGAHASSGGDNSAGGKKGGHHHESAHHKYSGETGGAGKEGKKSEYSKGGGKKTSHHDSGSHGGEHDEHGGGGSEGGYKAGAHKKAAGFTKGFRDKYHKDEYHKQAKFWKDGHESGQYEKFGNKGSSHYGDKGAHKKGETHNAGSSGGQHGKKGQTASGHNHADQSGYNKENGSSHQSSNESDYAKKGSSEHSKKHGDEAAQ